MNYITQLTDLNKSIISCKNLVFKDLTILPATDETKKEAQKWSGTVHPSFIEYFNEVKSYQLSWESKIKLKEKLFGKVKLIEPVKTMSDWKGVVYFEDDSPLRFFKVLDQFINEACCGFFTTESETAVPNMVYYYDFENEPVSLHLTMVGYIDMLAASKGYLYWQRVLLDHIGGVESVHTQQMKNDLNKVFTGFDFNEFTKKYDSVKL